MLHFPFNSPKRFCLACIKLNCYDREMSPWSPTAPLSLLLNHPLSIVLQLFVIINHSHIFSFLSRSSQHYIAMRMLPFHGIGQSTAASCLCQIELLWWTNVTKIPSFHVCQSPTSCPSLRCDPRDVLCICRTGHFQQTGHGLASSCIKLHCHDIEMFPTIPWCSSFHVSHFPASYSNRGAILKMSMANFKAFST